MPTAPPLPVESPELDRVATLEETHLSMPRRKRIRLLNSILYRILRGARAVCGPNRLLSLCLDLTWIIRRVAYELAGEVYGAEFHSRSLALTEEELRRIVPKGGSVVDIGCGTGRWSRIAAGFAGEVVAIDYDPTRIELARKTSAEQHIRYVVGDATSLKLPHRYDVALLIHLLEHLDDVDPLLTSLGGLVEKLVVEVPDFEAEPLNLARHVRGQPFYSDADHVREYTASILRQHLERNGWEISSLSRKGGAILAVASRAGAENGIVADGGSSTSTT